MTAVGQILASRVAPEIARQNIKDARMFGVIGLGSTLLSDEGEGITGFLGSAVNMIGMAAGVASIAAMFIPGLQAVAAIGWLVKAATIGFMAKGAFSILKGLGQMLTGNFTGGLGSILTGGITIALSLPWSRIGNLGSAWNKLKTAAMETKPCAQLAEQYGVTSIGRDSIARMNGGIKALGQPVKAETQLLRTAEGNLVQTEKELARACGNPAAKRLVKPNQLTDDIIRMREQELTTALTKATEAQALATKAVEKAATDQAAKQAAEQALATTTKQAELAAQRLTKFKELTAQRLRHQQDIANIQTRLTECRRLQQQAIMARDEAQQFLIPTAGGPVPVRSEAAILAQYNGSLQRVGINPRRFMEEAFEMCYGPSGRSAVSSICDRTSSIYNSFRSKPFGEALKDTATAGRDGFWRFWDWFRAGRGGRDPVSDGMLAALKPHAPITSA